MAPEAGTFRVVFLAQPSDLRTIYADIGAFTAQYLARQSATVVASAAVPCCSRCALPLRAIAALLSGVHNSSSAAFYHHVVPASDLPEENRSRASRS